MQKGLVTVVLPIYKTEKYLDRCIYSVVNQTYRNLEILLIDDGSPDRCPQMCEEWAKKDARIRVIHKTNAGLGMARNTGIEHATGEFICYFDSDDYVALDAIEKTYAKAMETQAEVVVFGFHSVDPAGTIRSSFAPPAGHKVYRAEEVRSVFLPELIAPDPNGNGERQFYMSACMMLISVEKIRRNDWRFVSEREIISEDVYSLLGLFRFVDSVAVLPEALYYYCTNETSLSRKYLPGRYQKIRHFYEESIALCDRMGYGEEVKRRLSDPYLAFARAAMKQEVDADLPYRNRLQNIKAIINDEVMRRVLEENKTDSASLPRRILFFAMKYRMYFLCFALLGLKNKTMRS